MYKMRTYKGRIKMTIKTIVLELDSQPDELDISLLHFMNALKHFKNIKEAFASSNSIEDFKKDNLK